MTKKNTHGFTLSLATLFMIGMSLFLVKMAGAMELDWSGQFRSEVHLIHNYTMDGTELGNTNQLTRSAAGGYYIPGNGSTDGNFRTLFMRLRPKVIINDAISIKSEWWVGDPIYGMFGNAVPRGADQHQYLSTSSAGSSITAQRFLGEFGSDFGTVQVGRAPLNWGLGLIWNNGDGLWDRYESTGDVIRIVSKFGSFTFIPSFVSYSMGSGIGVGSSSVADYSVSLKYDNLEEGDIEVGVNFVKRLAGASQNIFLGPSASSATEIPVGMNFNTWDIFGRKKLGKVLLSAEVPIAAGNIGGLDYSTIAFAGEANWKISDTWEVIGKVGHAPGQSNPAGATLDKYNAFYFNPNYRLGLIMFNYNLNNFAGPNTTNDPASGALKSPFDNPIANANYGSLYGAFHTDKWTFSMNGIYAVATQTAVVGRPFYNHLTHSVPGTVAVKSQGSSLGLETDLGVMFQWDEYFQFHLDSGLFFPGEFFKFSNAAQDNTNSTVWATVARIGVVF